MSAILFDFFGTRVSYSRSRVDQGYPRCHAFLREHGSALSYDDFLARIDERFASFDARSDIDDRAQRHRRHSPAMAGITAYLIDPGKPPGFRLNGGSIPSSISRPGAEYPTDPHEWGGGPRSAVLRVGRGDVAYVGNAGLPTGRAAPHPARPPGGLRGLCVGCVP